MRFLLLLLVAASSGAEVTSGGSVVGVFGDERMPGCDVVCPGCAGRVVVAVGGRVTVTGRVGRTVLVVVVGRVGGEVTPLGFSEIHLSLPSLSCFFNTSREHVDHL